MHDEKNENCDKNHKHRFIACDEWEATCVCGKQESETSDDLVACTCPSETVEKKVEVKTYYGRPIK